MPASSEQPLRFPVCLLAENWCQSGTNPTQSDSPFFLLSFRLLGQPPSQSVSLGRHRPERAFVPRLGRLGTGRPRWGGERPWRALAGSPSLRSPNWRSQVRRETRNPILRLNAIGDSREGNRNPGGLMCEFDRACWRPFRGQIHPFDSPSDACPLWHALTNAPSDAENTGFSSIWHLLCHCLTYEGKGRSHARKLPVRIPCS